MGRKNDFPLPEMPGVCLSCGSRGPLAPRKFVFNHTTNVSLMIALISPLIGLMYARRTAYHLTLPVCGDCSASLRRAKMVSVFGTLLFFPVFVGSLLLALDYPLLLAVPLVYGLAAYFYHDSLLKRGRPKTMRVDKNNVILFVPDYGEFVLFERDPSASRRGAKPRAAGAPMLNRSVCAGCGFINFPGTPECKKCRAPLAQTAAA
jgi:hypothetical protein